MENIKMENIKMENKESLKTGMLPLLLVALVLAIIDIRKNKKCQK